MWAISCLKLGFCAVGGKVGNLGLERLRDVGSGIDDCRAEIKNFAGIAFPCARKSAGLGVQAHAKQAVVLRSSRAEHVCEGHAANFTDNVR
jgi:hypothetical protein